MIILSRCRRIETTKPTRESVADKKDELYFSGFLNTDSRIIIFETMASSGDVVCEKLNSEREDTLCLCVHPAGELYSGHESCFMQWKDGKRIESVSLTGVVNSITCSPLDDNFLSVAVDNAVVVYDRRSTSKPLQEFRFNQEEVNHTALNEKGNFLAACDDSGEVKIIDLESNKLYKTLTKHHTNICNSVQFRPTKPSELITGALDCTVVRWDYTRNQPLDKISMQLGEHDSYSINPPMVHTISIADHGNTFVCGLGNGSVVVYKILGKNITRLACMRKLHDACCSHLQHARFSSSNGDCLLSGGNDGKVLMFQVMEEEAKEPLHSSQKKLTAGKAAGKGKSRRKLPSDGTSTKPLVDIDVTLSLPHGAKVNWITSAHCGHVYVADHTPYISVYQLR